MFCMFFLHRMFVKIFNKRKHSIVTRIFISCDWPERFILANEITEHLQPTKLFANRLPVVFTRLPNVFTRLPVVFTRLPLVFTRLPVVFTHLRLVYQSFSLVFTHLPLVFTRLHAFTTRLLSSTFLVLTLFNTPPLFWLTSYAIL